MWRGRFGSVLAAANAAACLLFVLVREPISGDYLAELEEVHRSSGISINSAIMGTMACRTLYSWSEWHGGEALGVKVLEAVNAPAFIFAQFVDVFGNGTVASHLSFCTWSWVVACCFFAAASIQWIALGAFLEFVTSEIRRRWRWPG